LENHFSCKNKQRRNLIAEPVDADQNPITPKINGIDYLEIGSLDQVTINLYFIHHLPGQTDEVPQAAPALKKENFLITGGERIKNIKVEEIKSTSGNLIKIAVNQPGDFSTYTLSLITSPTNTEPPTGFDTQLSTIDFSFKVTCPNDFDCKVEPECPPENFVQPEIDYLAKDYNSFRGLMLDRLSILMPGWKERNPADMQIALVELLAYVGDHLSYYQDAVATEAYLGTAHKRISVRRHARLLDYRMNDGCNARVWVHIEVIKDLDADGMMLPKGTPLITGDDNSNSIIKDLQKILPENPAIFETMHNLFLNSAHNEILFYTWGDSECCLPKGSTSATLLNDNLEVNLKAGDVLIFEEKISPVSGIESDADLNHRHPVRLKKVNYKEDVLMEKSIIEIEWFEEDELPFPLCLSAKIVNEDNETQIIEVSVAKGNVVLADFGFTVESDSLNPKLINDEIDFRPKLAHKNITFSQPFLENEFKLKGASKAIRQDLNKVLPQVKLFYEQEIWTPKLDLLASDRFANEFICEVENDGTTIIRFGDDVLGKKPSLGIAFKPVYRVGNGAAGNVGADSIKRILTDFDGISKIRNPLPAKGGINPESIERVKQVSPQAFRIQQRAVTEEDYAEVTERNEEVQKAAANFRWTGSWNTVFVTVDRKSGFEVDEEYRNNIYNHVDQFRLAGYDLEINKPVFVSLEIEFDVCVKDGYFQLNIKESLLKKFSAKQLPGGGKGFFHPDNFTFGQPVYLSQLYQTAMDINGVGSVEITKFKRYGKKLDQEIEKGLLQPASLEIIRLDNDPNFPENGKINFIIHGGL
jgi:hypothetical protein